MNARIALFVLVALLLGVGLGFGVSQMVAPAPQVARGPANIADEPEEESSEPQRRPRDTATVERPAPNPREEPVGEAPSLSADMLKDLQRLVPPTGTGVVTGSFRDHEDKPVAGIAVRLQSEVSDLMPKMPQVGDFGADNEAWLNALMRYYYQSNRLRLDATQRVLSDAEGKFRIERAAERSQLTVTPDGYMIDPGQPMATRDAKPGDNFDFKLRRTVNVRARVESPAETERRNVRVQWTAAPNLGWAGGQPAELNTETVLRMVPGTYEIRATSNSGRGGSLVLILGDTPPAEVLLLSFQPTRGLTGKVLFESARPSSYDVVIAQAIADLTQEELFSGRRGLVSANATLNRETGEFSWEPREEGEYLVALRINGRIIEAQRAMLGATLTKIELTAKLPEGQRMRVLFQCPKEFELRELRNPGIGITSIPQGQQLQCETWVAGEGDYLLIFRGYDGSKPMPQRARATAWVNGLGMSQQEFAPGIDSEITIVFGAAAEVTLAVEGGGAGLRQVNVQLTDIAREQSGAGFSVSKGQDGLWRRETQKMQPGRYRVVATGDWGGGATLATQEVTLVSGPNTIPIKLPEMYIVKLDGSVAKLRGQVTVEQKSTGMKFQANFDNNGVALLTLLPAGSYHVTYRHPQRPREESTADFTVPTSGAIVLQ